MASIAKREWVDKAGLRQIRYDACVTRKGYRRQVRTFKKEAMAVRWVKLVEADQEKGVYKSIGIAERMTLREAMSRYVREVSSTKRSYQTEVSNANMIDPYLGSYPLISLDNEVLAAYRDKRLAMKAKHASRQRGGPFIIKELKRRVSKATIRHELSFLSRVIEHARREWGVHLPAGNPVRLVKLPAMGRPRERRMEGDEEKRLLSYLSEGNAFRRGRGAYTHSLVIFAIETAARRSEIVRLRWDDIDLSGRTCLLRDTKNGEDRRIGLSTRAIEALITIPRCRDGSVFPLTTNAVSLAWKRATRACGIENLRFHDLRHEATSRLATKFNGDVMAMAAMTGHKSLQMLKRYTHLRAEELALRLG